MVSAEGVESLSADGWMEPGDLARLTPTGHVQLAGRAKDAIIRGGANSYPAEIEAALLAHESIAEACAFGIADARLGERVAAVVVLKQGAAHDEAALRAFASGRLAAYKTPERYFFVEEMPRNSSEIGRAHV